MQCPHDQSVLVMAQRKGVEIDYCPQCRGVWLDRGELEKIIDRSMEAEIAAEAGTPLRTADPAEYPVPAGGDRRAEPHGSDTRQDDESERLRKKDSWLLELFDF